MKRYQTEGGLWLTRWELVRNWCLYFATLATVVVGLMLIVSSCTTADASELPIVVQTIVGECANCSDEGMMAVANVIRNRARLRGQTVEEVCLAKWQFSFWNDRGRAKKFIKNQSRPVIERAWAAWQASGVEDITQGSDHYFANYIKMPSWAHNMDFKAQYGVHRFYRS